MLSRVILFVTPWTVSPPGSSLHEIFLTWNGLPFPPPGDLPDLGIGPVSPTTEPPGTPYSTTITNHSTEKQLD